MESAYKTCMEQKKNAEKFENWERMVKRDSVSFLQVVVQKYLQDQIPFEKLTEVLETVCANGWRGFKADWITKGSGKKTETIAERNARIEREIFGQSLDDEARTIDMEKIA